MKTEKEKIKQWDFIDNAIFELIKTTNPSKQEIKWDIHVISEIRSTLVNLFVNELKLCTEDEFYP